MSSQDLSRLYAPRLHLEALITTLTLLELNLVRMQQFVSSRCKLIKFLIRSTAGHVLSIAVTPLRARTGGTFATIHATHINEVKYHEVPPSFPVIWCLLQETTAYLDRLDEKKTFPGIDCKFQWSNCKSIGLCTDLLNIITELSTLKSPLVTQMG